MSRTWKISAAVLAALVAATTAAVLANRTTPRRAGAVSPTAAPLPRGLPATATPPAPPSSTGPTTTTTTTPPGVVSLTARLDATLAGTNSCLAVTDGSTPIYLRQAGAALAPASTQKLLVAAAALRVLGPNFRFVTQVLAPAPPVGGRVAALWLVGGGDPLLATPEYVASVATQKELTGYPWTPLASLADAVTAAGISSVPGGIRGDDRRYDRLRFLPAWPQADLQENDVGALTALPLNEGIQQWHPTVTLATDPPSFAASELARLLALRHTVVAPSVNDQTAPAGAVMVAQVQSAPLSQIVESMLRVSDNFIAELLVRELDHHAGGPGTTAGGTSVVLQQATALGISVSGAVMLDGSGLAPGDRATCLELLGALNLTA